ncbi:MAG: universal stress protein [Abitibacteriaceae bacterium]|nr:universal stress protein [Abditibacteriaceae bacterium]
MYKKVLVALENSAADETILRHIEPLLQLLHSEVLLVHVADGFAARNFDQLKLAESTEMKGDRTYLETVANQLRDSGITTETQLLLGDPATQIIKLAHDCHADLIAMSTHGHRLLGDMIYGSTVDKVRHTVDIPVLLLKAPKS